MTSAFIDCTLKNIDSYTLYTNALMVDWQTKLSSNNQVLNKLYAEKQALFQ